MNLLTERSLTEAIAADIRAAGGAINFARFMELALYHPRFGYYVAEANQPVGRHGDYVTSVSVGPIFGRILARQFLTFQEELGHPPDFEVVEFGGRQGQLRDDVLREAPGLHYRIVEARDPAPDRIVGCVFSNEVLDALPVHRVRAVGGEWRELYVAEGRGTRPFEETTGPLSSPRLAEALAGLPVAAMEGYTTEVNLRALDWIADIGRRLQRGFVLTIDYGYARQDYFAPHRRDGTLRCYRRHVCGSDPLVRVGQQDITAHVEFTSVIEQGRRAGLEPVLFAEQSEFLLEAGREIIEDIVRRDAGRPSPERRMIHQLIHPSFMGRAFKVLIQRKRSDSVEIDGADTIGRLAHEPVGAR